MELIRDLDIYAKEEGKRRARWGLYLCPLCNTEFEARTSNVKKDNTTTCGCFRYSNTTDIAKHRLYKTWAGMVHRCYNPKAPSFKWYGARGISVCEEWRACIDNFIQDMFPSFEEGLSLDRVDNSLGYSKYNCRWADRATQGSNTTKLRSNNTSGYRGVSFSKGKNKFVAVITVRGKSNNLGCFTDPKEAAEAYDQYVIDNNLEHTKNFS